jgi:hypothetical protein
MSLEQDSYLEAKKRKKKNNIKNKLLKKYQLCIHQGLVNLKYRKNTIIFSKEARTSETT